MPKITLIFSVLYIALGLAAFSLTGAVHKTALIPAYFGIVLLVLGLLGQKENLRKHVMHAALLVVLEPGAYTAQISGSAASTGVALLELYDVP